MHTLVLILIGFLSGSLPFSYWLGKSLHHIDIRSVGDGNPGASNVFLAGSRWVGVLAIILDFSKGFFPVLLLASGIGSHNQLLFTVFCISPVLGHAFSPFMGCRGGKAIAVTFGIWSGLTLWVVPTTLGILLAWGRVCVTISSNGWIVMLALVGTAGSLVILRVPQSYWFVWCLNIVIVGYKHRVDLSQPLRISSRRTTC